MYLFWGMPLSRNASTSALTILSAMSPYRRSLESFDFQHVFFYSADAPPLPDSLPHLGVPEKCHAVDDLGGSQ
jgi:hypothetical protein